MTRFRLAALFLTAALITTGCNRYLVHPGSVNTFDSVAYDTLTVAKASLDQARTEYKAGKIAPSWVPSIDKLAIAYDAAYPVWQQWRAAVLAKDPKATTLLATLQQAMTDLNAAINAWKQVRPAQ